MNVNILSIIVDVSNELIFPCKIIHPTKIGDNKLVEMSFVLVEFNFDLQHLVNEKNIKP